MKIYFSFRLESFFLGLGLFTCCGLGLSVVTACAWTIDCLDRLPTISYTSKFPGHDKLFIFLMTLYALGHFWIYVTINSLLPNTCFSKSVKFTGLITAPLLLGMTFIDQNISKDLHAILAFLFLGCGAYFVISVKAVLLPRLPILSTSL